MNDVTVVIPVFNASEFLEETLESVWRQTLLPDEIVLVDDKSTDDTIDVVRNSKLRSPVPIRLIELKENSGGPARPMNIGVEAARTRFVTMLDHDDWMAPERIEHSVFASGEYRDDLMVMGNYYLVRNGSVVTGSNSCDRFPELKNELESQTQSFAFLRREKWLNVFFRESIQCSCSNHFFPKRLWAEIGGYRENAGLSSDFDFAIRGFRGGVVWLKNQAFNKRVHDQNAWQPSVKNVLLALRLREEFLDRFCDKKDRDGLGEEFLDILHRDISWLRWNGYHADSLLCCKTAWKRSARFWIIKEVMMNMIRYYQKMF